MRQPRACTQGDAFLQIDRATALSEMKRSVICACREAKEKGADIALFPEMWSNGYEIPEDINALKSMAVLPDGDFVNTFGKLAAELDMAIAITILEQHEPLPRNTVILFN